MKQLLVENVAHSVGFISAQPSDFFSFEFFVSLINIKIKSRE